jgi:hypothetical protein
MRIGQHRAISALRTRQRDEHGSARGPRGGLHRQLRLDRNSRPEAHQAPGGNRPVLSFTAEMEPPVGDTAFSKTVYALIADESVYVFALCVNEEQAEANSPLFQAIIRSLEIPE